MHDFGLNKVAAASVFALILGGSPLVSAASAVAADLGPYVTDEEAVLNRPPIRRRIVVEESQDAPFIEHRAIERRVVEHRIADDYEGPALVPPQPLRIVPMDESEGYEGPALVPPQDIPVLSLQGIMPPPLPRQRIVHVPTPIEECRVVVTKRIDAFGEVVVRKAHICD